LTQPYAYMLQIIHTNCHLFIKSSAVAEMATQRCTSQIFVVKCGYISLMHFF